MNWISDSWIGNALLLAGLWLASSVIVGAFLGFVGAIAWKVAQWLL